jgi:hypothetical protein
MKHLLWTRYYSGFLGDNGEERRQKHLSALKFTFKGCRGRISKQMYKQYGMLESEVLRRKRGREKGSL